MRFYPDVPARRRATIATDVAVLLALLALAAAALKVRHDVNELASLSQGVQTAGSAVQGGFDAAADAFGGAPIIGPAVGSALREVGDRSGGEAVRAGRESEEDINRLATLLGAVVFFIPAALMLARYGPARLTQAKRLGEARSVLSDPTDPARRRAVAMRAAFSLPYGALLRHTRDPLGDLAAERYDPLLAAAYEDAGLVAPGSASPPLPA
jgi:hypothetical protein